MIYFFGRSETPYCSASASMKGRHMDKDMECDKTVNGGAEQVYEGVQDVEDHAENAQTVYCIAISQILSGKCMNMIYNLTGTGCGDHE